MEIDEQNLAALRSALYGSIVALRDAVNGEADLMTAIETARALNNRALSILAGKDE